MTITTILSLLGAVLLLGAYVAVQENKLDSRGIPAALLNFAGAAILAGSALRPLNVGLFVVELFWSLLSLRLLVTRTVAARKGVALVLTLAFAVTGSERAFAQVLTPSQPVAHQHAHSAAAHTMPHPAVHGMVLFGKDKLYASHIPMFAAPHDWQVELEVEIKHQRLDAKQAYLDAAFATGEQALVTMKPSPFVLPKVISGEVTTFTGDLFMGSFEDGGLEFLSGVEVKVTKVTFAKQLSPQTPALSDLTYAVGPGGQYLTHLISAPANFDHIVSFTWVVEPPFDAASLDIGTEVHFPPQDLVQNRLQKGQLFSLHFVAGQWSALPVATEGFGVGPVISIAEDFYCTPGPNFFGPCP